MQGRARRWWRVRPFFATAFHFASVVAFVFFVTLCLRVTDPPPLESDMHAIRRWLTEGPIMSISLNRAGQMPLLFLAVALTLQPPSIAGEPEPTQVRCELAVIGGGSGGFGAALAAARLGVDVVLVERADCLGGNSVRSGVNCWEMGAGGTGIPFDLYLSLKTQPLAVGVYSFSRHLLWYDAQQEPYRYPGGETVIDPDRRYRDTLRRYGSRGMAKDEAFCREHWHGVPFEPDAMAQTMLTMLRETQHCRVMLNTAFVEAETNAGHIDSVQLSNGARLVADYYVDATGDGVVCISAGCPLMKGQESRERFGEPSAPPEPTDRVNGVTLLYRVAQASSPEVETLPDEMPGKCWWQSHYPVASVNHYPNGDLNINMLPTMDGHEFLRRGYADARKECERRVRAHWHDLQTRFAEFRMYRLSWIAPALGIRETQRIVGQYVLVEQDLRAGVSNQTHDDIICLADHAMDTHGSHAHGIGELGEPYGVPYRCLIPKGTDNLLIACRAASFSSLAASSCRLSRTMMQLGQAAGTAAALAKELDTSFPEVPPDRLRKSLREQHVQLDHPMPTVIRRRLEQE